jgi:hypothetical protein
MRRHLFGLCFVTLASITAIAAIAQSRPGYLLFTDPLQRFSIEFPRDWRWMMVSGSGEPIATFVDPRSEAAVVVERFRLKQRLGPDDITGLFAELEVEYLKEHQRGVQNVVARVTTRGAIRAVVVDYSRPGQQEQERVRMYSFPAGEDLYRVTCAALASRFQMFEADFEAIVSTLKTAATLRQP